MSGSTFGNIFKITTWGESHGKALGVVIDGCPSGLSLNEEDIQIYLNRRNPANPPSPLLERKTIRWKSYLVSLREKLQALPFHC